MCFLLATTNGGSLSMMRPPPETFIQFSCGTMQTDTSQRGVVRNSLFTKHLLRHIAEENVPIGEMLQRVTDDVYRESNGKQKSLCMNGLRLHKQVYINEVIVGT